MSADDARKVLTIMVAADGYCSVCASDLIERFIGFFPEHTDLANEILGQQDVIMRQERKEMDEREP